MQKKKGDRSLPPVFWIILVIAVAFLYTSTHSYDGLFVVDPADPESKGDPVKPPEQHCTLCPFTGTDVACTPDGGYKCDKECTETNGKKVKEKGTKVCDICETTGGPTTGTQKSEIKGVCVGGQGGTATAVNSKKKFIDMMKKKLKGKGPKTGYWNGRPWTFNDDGKGTPNGGGADNEKPDSFTDSDGAGGITPGEVTVGNSGQTGKVDKTPGGKPYAHF